MYRTLLLQGLHLWTIKDHYVAMDNDGKLQMIKGIPNQNYGPSKLIR